MDAKTKELLGFALKFMCWNSSFTAQDTDDLYATRKGIEAKLAEPYPGIDNPVAWVEVEDRTEGPYEFHGIEYLPRGKHNLYARPQKREPLSFDEIEDLFPDGHCYFVETDEYPVRLNEKGEVNIKDVHVNAQWLHDFARAIERKINGIGS